MLNSTQITNKEGDALCEFLEVKGNIPLTLYHTTYSGAPYTRVGPSGALR